MAFSNRVNEVIKLIQDKTQLEVEHILGENKESLEYFAQRLIEKEELEYDEIIEIFREYGKERSQDTHN